MRSVLKVVFALKINTDFTNKDNGITVPKFAQHYIVKVFMESRSELPAAASKTYSSLSLCKKPTFARRNL
jgi:hypothetical protein